MLSFHLAASEQRIRHKDTKNLLFLFAFHKIVRFSSLKVIKTAAYLRIVIFLETDTRKNRTSLPNIGGVFLGDLRKRDLLTLLSINYIKELRQCLADNVERPFCNESKVKMG